MKDFAESLRRESADWVGRGIVSAEQRDRVLELYPADADHPSRFLTVLSSVGGALLALGVILVIASNWEDIGDWVKIGGLLVLLLAAYGAGWALKVRPGGYPRIGESLLMVGSILFMAGIALVSQIFHLDGRLATALLIWWLGIVLVPLLTGSRGAQLVSLVAFLSWLGTELYTADSPLRIVAILDNLDNDHAWITGFAYASGVGLALFLLGLGLRQSRFDLFAGMHEKWGLLVLHAGLYVLGFTRHSGNWSQADAIPRVAWLPGLLLAAALLGAAALAWRRRPAELRRLSPWLALALIPTVGVLAGSELNDDGWLWSILAWVGLFLLDLGLVRTGVESGREGWVNLALGFLGINILTRYFDLFGTLLDGGVLFLTSGAIILAVGIYLEKKRRRLLSSLREATA
jgi:uncharacterized membrane protein